MNKSKTPAVQVENLTKHYGPVTALNAVNCVVESGSYFVLLGPSGGGKTTLLRLIGGFIRPNAGRVVLHGEDVSALPPNRRPTSMVFQSFALFPHMNVERNVGYGLKLQKMPAAEMRDQVRRMLSLVGLDGYESRMPHELSGGQQQRVQLARSLVLERDILLLDEPLAALDAKLRKDMCIELKRLQEKVGITFIHVTHNQEEAMTIADRIAIIADGELVEQGTPREIYERPVRRFTAAFVGENNLLDGRVLACAAGSVTLDLGFARVDVDARSATPGKDDAASMSIRSELLTLTARDDAADGDLQTIPASYVEQVYLGLTTSHLVRLPNGAEFTVRQVTAREAEIPFAPGDAVSIRWQTSAARLHTD